MVKVAPHLAKIVDGNAGDVGAAPGGDLAVPVFANDEGVDAPAVHRQMLPQGVFQPGRIQHRARADDPVFREAAQLDGCVGEDVHGIGDDE